MCKQKQLFSKDYTLTDDSVLNQLVLNSSMTKKKKTGSKKTTTKQLVSKRTAKKTVKKATKKITNKPTKQAVTKSKHLVCATDDKCFWVNGGPILRDLVELEQAFDEMNEQMFSHHVAKNRNDFADWVESVLKDAETAAALRKAKKPNTARKVVIRQLKFYKLPS